MQYRIKIRPQALKSLKKIPESDRKLIIRRIDSLEQEPRPEGSKKLKRADDLYRIRVGDYQVIYQVQDKVLLVLVVRIKHRKDAYR